ncbi:hypothetical protein PI126_g21772, partial [Phytophthora idaei]
MKPFRLRSFGVAAFFLAAADTTQAVVNLAATVVYTSGGDCSASTGTPVLVTAVPDPTTGCSVSNTCTESPASSSLYPATVCSTTDGTANGAFIKTKLPAIFGSSPYVIMETYTAEQLCAAAQLSGITTYLADGKCHKTDTATSYRATRKADGSATIQPYGDATCSSAGSLVTVTVAQTANSCAEDDNGILDTKVYGAGTTPLYLTSTVNYDTTANTCSTGVPSLVSTAVANVDTTCSTTSGCTGNAAPYTGTKCSSASSYLTDMATAFGVNPYVIVQKYNAAKSCADAELSGITTYLADGKCHKTDTAKSYRVTRSADNSATIKTYTDAVCSTGVVSATVSAADGTSNACVSDAKVYGAGATPLYLSSTVNYDTSANTCKSGLPSFVTTSVVVVDACSATTTCTGQAAPYSGTSCSSTLTYKDDMAAAFGSNPYVIVEKYTAGQACAAAQLSGITTYLADGKCHKTDTAKSYRAARKADGSATVQSYTDAVCGTSGTVFIVSAADGTAHACVSDTKVYGDNTTPLYLTSTVNYDTTANTCSTGVPSLVSTAVANVDTTCSTTSGCTGNAAPY